MRGIFLAITSVRILACVVTAEARIVCRFASSCETAQKWCLARRNRAMNAANCEASFKSCKPQVSGMVTDLAACFSVRYAPIELRNRALVMEEHKPDEKKAAAVNAAALG